MSVSSAAAICVAVTPAGRGVLTAEDCVVILVADVVVAMEAEKEVAMDQEVVGMGPVDEAVEEVAVMAPV